MCSCRYPAHIYNFFNLFSQQFWNILFVLKNDSNLKQIWVLYRFRFAIQSKKLRGFFRVIFAEILMVFIWIYQKKKKKYIRKNAQTKFSVACQTVWIKTIKMMIPRRMDIVFVSTTKTTPLVNRFSVNRENSWAICVLNIVSVSWDNRWKTINEPQVFEKTRGFWWKTM